MDTVWTDYLGGTVYGDFTVVEDEGSPVYTDLNAFLPGIGRVDPHGTPSAVEYYHANQIGTTRAMTDNGGDDEQGVVYTAFGERVGGTDHRYGYAGAWGYRSHDDFACNAPQSPEYQFPYLHVGWRYYDPASGRFLQRDPIGIYGGWNVYAYVSSVPTLGIDPTGLGWFGGAWTKISGFFTGCVALDIMYHLYLHHGTVIKNLGVRLLVLNALLLHQAEHQPKINETAVLGDEVRPSSICVIVYIKLPDRRISVVYKYDGNWFQFYIKDKDEWAG